DVLALPALCVDIDAEPQAALLRLHQHDPPPSCIVYSGAGLHAYWWLDEPTTDLVAATHILTRLHQQFASDPLSVSQSMRLPGSINTKPERHNSRCTLHSISPTSYPLHAFAVENRPSTRTGQTGQTNHTASTNGQPKSNRIATPRELNPRLIEVVSGLLERRYEGFWRRSGWLAARCPCPHEHDQPGAHFSFNPAIGLGVCLGKHGRLLLKDLCTLLDIRPADYGGLFR
ncbi:MAG: RepB family DNA primase, partial [Acidobacteriales bacterium]|nr:RepB family DNA primase [Terriglobales bacterium]